MSAARILTECSAPTQVRFAENQMQADNNSADGYSLLLDPLHCTGIEHLSLLWPLPSQYFSTQKRSSPALEETCPDEIDACFLGMDEIRLLFLPHPILINSTHLLWDGTESAKYFRKALLPPCLCQSWGNNDGLLSISLFPFLLNIMLEKRIKKKKKGTLMLLLSPFSAYCSPYLQVEATAGDTWGYAAFSRPEKQRCRAAEGREAKPRVCIWRVVR